MNRSAVKKAYKQAKHPMGVYRISNSLNEKVFVGVATDLTARFNRHKAELRFGSHRNWELQKIWNTGGEQALTFEILDELNHEKNIQANSNEELHALAEMWVERLEKTGDSVIYLKN